MFWLQAWQEVDLVSLAILLVMWQLWVEQAQLAVLLSKEDERPKE
jgi:hypothetical protein